ncbi:hypothetical protein AWENTII_002317 [Aspergillus wentii]|nr:hypothetical protein MW887_008087 [Aspergillus wentii]
MALFSTRIIGPSEWEREYAPSDAVLKVPFVRAVDKEGRIIINIRDVYLDIDQVLSHHLASLSVYADVLAFREEMTTLNVPKLGKVFLYTRLLATSGSTHLVFPREECAVYIHASEVDGHITFSLADSDTVFTLDLGVGSKHVAVLLYPQGDTVKAEYDAHYDPMSGMHPYFQQLLETQLPISSVLF